MEWSRSTALSTLDVACSTCELDIASDDVSRTLDVCYLLTELLLGSSKRVGASEMGVHSHRSHSKSEDKNGRDSRPDSSTRTAAAPAASRGQQITGMFYDRLLSATDYQFQVNSYLESFRLCLRDHRVDLGDSHSHAAKVSTTSAADPAGACTMPSRVSSAHTC